MGCSELKKAIHEGKYTFQATTGDHAAFKEVSLEVLSRGGYVFFDQKQFIEAFIDKINSRNQCLIPIMKQQ